MQAIRIEKQEADPELNPRSDDDFAKLVKLHHRDLLVYARALTKDPVPASDIVQEAFIAAYEKVHTFDVTRDFAAWMRGIVRNKWHEWLRKNHRYLLDEENLARIDADVAAWQQKRAQGSSTLLEALELCLQRLPEGLAAAVHASYYEGRSSDEAAASLGLSAAAVRKRLQRARELLKECLNHKLEQAPGEDSRPA
ncbi:MAG: RNA polymerase sigma factor [Verrucomicrobiota bacterium]